MSQARSTVLRRAVVAFGANLPWRGSPPEQTIREAARMMAGRSDITTFEASRLWQSTPVNAEGPNFINAVAQFDTRLTAQDLLDWLLSVERAYGRERTKRPAPGPSAARTLDLDLIWMTGIRLQTPDLTLPHPGPPSVASCWARSWTSHPSSSCPMRADGIRRWPTGGTSCPSMRCSPPLSQCARVRRCRLS